MRDDLFLIYICLINLADFILFGIDKWKAVHGKWRIPEATLLGVACIGGSVGALLGMLLFRHKIRKPKFKIGIPAILFLQAAVYVYLKSQVF